jgi:hypothetical protein
MMLRPIANAVAQRGARAMAALVLLWVGMLLLGGSGSRLDDWLLSRLYAGDAAVLAAIAAALTGWVYYVVVFEKSMAACSEPPR